MNHLNCQGKYLDNSFICYNCTFDNNRGGGVIIFASKDVCPYRFGNIAFNKGNCTKNTSPMGSCCVYETRCLTAHKKDFYQSQGSKLYF